MRKFSKKRSKENYEYGKLRKAFLTENPMCQIRVAGCTGMAQEIHHKKGRIGKLLTDTAYFCATCNSCHHWAEMNPLEAKKRGVSISRLSI